jgi:hypothetical protein
MKNWSIYIVEDQGRLAGEVCQFSPGPLYAAPPPHTHKPHFYT